MKASLTVLGSGTSMGVPTIGCGCEVCRSTDPHDNRTRPSILVEYAGRVVLIDTTPDFRTQALREGIRQVDAVLYTHAHADHILGLDDLRPLSFLRPGKIPLYAREDTAEVIRRIFRYIFDGKYKFGGLAQVELNIIDGPVELFGGSFVPLTVIHGDAEIFGLPLRLLCLSDGFQLDSGRHLRPTRKSGPAVSRRVTAYSPSHAFDR